MNPLTAAFEFVSISPSSGSTEVRAFIAETVTCSFSAGSCMQMCVRDMAGQNKSILSPPLWNSSPKVGPPQRYTRSLQRCLRVHSQAVPGHSKLSRSLHNLIIAHHGFRLFVFKFLGNEQRKPGETSGRHSNS